MYNIAKGLPDVEKFGLASQFGARRFRSRPASLKDMAALAIRRRANVPSGARFLIELRDHLTTCVDEGYLGATEGERLDVLIQSVTRLLMVTLRDARTETDGNWKIENGKWKVENEGNWK